MFVLISKIYFIIVSCVLLFLVVRAIYNRFNKNQNKIDMEDTPKRKFEQSIMFKGIAIAVLILILLIPGAMIQNLIEERQERSLQTVRIIYDKWSQSQTLCAPILVVPYTTRKLDSAQRPYLEAGTLYVTPVELKINAALTPVERYYGIYKAILYKSDIRFEGYFSELENLKIDNSTLHFDKAQIAIGITDLRGITQNPDFKVNNIALETTVGEVNLGAYSHNAYISGKSLVANLKEIDLSENLRFNCTMQLNGSGAINFIPVGQNTAVTVTGQWQSPSFTGIFSPESTIDKEQFTASWNILSFNREIPDKWSNHNAVNLIDNSFGVNLIETVDHYQQNMRTAKYALMFIALTLVVFFFAEIFTKKTIHVFQYVLVGIALILFYSLLLSFSEQIGFSWAYFVASVATISMITAYFHSLIKQIPATITLAGIMFILYTFMYIILQVQDFALLFGSIFLFVILGVIMFVSNKIKILMIE